MVLPDFLQVDIRVADFTVKFGGDLFNQNVLPWYIGNW